MIEFLYALVLGILSIVSPCTFVVIPIMTSDLNCKLQKIFSFLIGITLTFTILGILSALTGKLLTNFLGPYLYLFAGLITMVSGLNMLNIIDMRLPALFTGLKTKNNFLTGLIYGGVVLGCVGPLLAPVLAYITAKASVLYGFLMMSFFSIGFIAPFILFGFLITDDKVSRQLMNYSVIIKKLGGISLLLASAYLLFITFRGII